MPAESRPSTPTRTGDVPAAAENLAIESLHLPARVYRCLKAAGLHTVESILQTPAADLLKIRHFGEKSMSVLTRILQQHGVNLNPAQTSQRKAQDLTVLLGMPVGQVGFPDSIVERIHLAQIERLGELVTKTAGELLRFPSLGHRGVQIIRQTANDLGLDLGMDFISIDEAGEKWMDRLDAARMRLSPALARAAERYFFCREYGISRKTLDRFLRNRPLSVYESGKLRRLFKDRVDTSKPFRMEDTPAHRQIMETYRAYLETGSLVRAAEILDISHEQVRLNLNLGIRLSLFTAPRGH